MSKGQCLVCSLACPPAQVHKDPQEDSEVLFTKQLRQEKQLMLIVVNAELV